jgi:hypothetical protein
MADSHQAAASQADADRAPMLKQYTFQETIQEVRVNIQIVMMKGSCMVWVGVGGASFSGLDVAMMTHMDAVPICSTLIGADGDSPGIPLAKRLALKFGLQALVSVNLPSAQPLLQAAVEKKVMKEIEGILASTSQPKAD